MPRLEAERLIQTAFRVESWMVLPTSAVSAAASLTCNLLNQFIPTVLGL
jgi:hypothetical protein